MDLRWTAARGRSDMARSDRMAEANAILRTFAMDVGASIQQQDSGALVVDHHESPGILLLN